MAHVHCLCALAVLFVTVVPVIGQAPELGTEPTESPAVCRVSDAMRSTLDALGASSGVPDGVGLSWYPRSNVRGQNARMSILDSQLGFTAPVYTSDHDLVFADASIRTLGFWTNAVLPTDRVRFPRSLWDIQAGGGYLHDPGNGLSWGVTLNIGTASDRPFNSLAEGTLSALAFLRLATGERTAWLYYVVSVSNGQLGRNIPVPGVAYEYQSDRLTAVVGFPFITVDYRPVREWQFEFNYAAITDVLTRASYHMTDHARLFADFEWTNQAWFRADRRFNATQLFKYEKRLEGGFGWQAEKRFDVRLSGGYAFNRFFVENQGMLFRGRNRVDLAPTAFITAQFEFKY